jgi:hypothetical protein
MAFHSIPTAFSNTGASLLGLPTELRLQIYSYLVEPTRFHIDEQSQDINARKWKFKHLRLCYTPDPTHPSLCAKPCFSGLCPPKALCHNISDVQLNRVTIPQVCRLLHEETKGMLDKDRIGLTIVQRTYEVPSVLSSMTLHQMEMLVDLTIQVLPASYGEGYRGLSPAVIYLRRNHTSFPNLRTVAVQTPQRLRNLAQDRFNPDANFDPEVEWRWQWFITELQEIFQGRVQIIYEGWIVFRAGHPITKSEDDEMMRIRGTVGNCNGCIYGEEGCKCTFEMVSNAIVGGRGAWTGYWQGRDMGYDREYSKRRAGGSTYKKSWVVYHRARVEWRRQQNTEMRERLRGSNWETRRAITH